MKWLLAVALLVISGCTVRLTGDASMLQKYDRPNESWSMETKGAQPTESPKTEAPK